MHGGTHRQLFSRFALVAALVLVPFFAAGGAAEDELRAAKLVENAVTTRWKENSSTEARRVEEEKVTRVYGQLIARYPKHAGIRSAFADYLLVIDQPAEAEAQWETAAQLDPKDPGIASRLGGCRLRAGRIKEADALFKKAVAFAPENASYHYDLAVTEFLFRQQLGPSENTAIEVALRHYRRAAELDASSLEYARGYAETFYGVPKPDWTEASRAWNHVLDISATKDFAFVNLARVSLRRGKKEQARNYLAQVQDSTFSRVKSSLMRQIDDPK